jgi:putative peptidoglycan lipid II flippase
MVRVLAPAFYALKDTRTPVVAAFVAFIVNLFCSLLLMRSMQHAGLALASSISSAANMLLLFYFLRKRIGLFGGARITATAARSLLSAIPACLAASVVLRQLDWSLPGAKLLKSGVMGLAVLVAILLYSLISLLLKSEEAREVKRVLLDRFAKK